MQKKIFWSIFGICFIWILVGFYISLLFFNNYYERQTFTQLKQSANYIIEGLKYNGIKYLKHVKTEHRITLIDSKGNVIYDNFVEINKLDNHSNRQEFENGIQHNNAQNHRYSTTMKEKMFYYATKVFLNENMIFNQKISQSNIKALPFILRISILEKNIITLLYDMIPHIIVSILLCCFASFFISKYIAKLIIYPLNNLNLNNPVSLKSYTEIMPLLNKIDEQDNLIQEQFKQLKTKQEEFIAITQNMEDGFLLLDYNGNVVSFNKGSTKLFAGLREGINISKLERFNFEWLIQAINDNIKTQLIEYNDRIYKIIIESVFSHNISNKQDIQIEMDSKNISNKVIGIAIIILDLTEKLQREKLRKEFSTNISHELKTPLTSIIGIIEMLKNNLIKDIDIPKFINNMYINAKQIDSLIENMIIINELDDNYNLLLYPIYIKDVCFMAVSMLSDLSKQNNISCNIIGDDFIIMGEQKLILLMIFHICKNAIKYNKNNGKVKILLNKENKSICIQDNGIGIHKMYHERIFERFFCVDKSHSNMINGAGLGLSIVKHIANIHQATINLESKIDYGTSITIYFK